MNDKLVSIIIPTYNRGDIIRETIISVLNQTYQNFQVIVIDDGSTDNTKNVVQSIKDKRIKYIFQNHSGLPATGRNTGLKQITGDYVAFLDSDDLWFPQKLEIQINLFDRNPDILLIATNGVFFPTKRNMRVLTLKKNINISFKQLLEKNIIINSSVLLRKEVIVKVGLLDENIRLKYGEDFDYWLRLLKFKDNSILLLKDVLVKYRENAKSIFNFYNSPEFFLKKYRIMAQIYEKYRDIYKDLFKKLIREIFYNYKGSKIRNEIITRKVNIFTILRDNYLRAYQKLKLLAIYLIYKFELPYLIKRIRILQSKIDYLKNLIIKLLK